MAQQEEQPLNQSRGVIAPWALWIGVLAGPVAWALSQQVAYLLATLDCSYGKNTWLSPVMVLTLLIAASGAWLSWRNWQRTGREAPDDGGSVIARSRFLSVFGLLLSSYSMLVIVAEWLPIFFYRQCQR